MDDDGEWCVHGAKLAYFSLQSPWSTQDYATMPSCCCWTMCVRCEWIFRVPPFHSTCTEQTEQCIWRWLVWSCIEFIIMWLIRIFIITNVEFAATVDVAAAFFSLTLSRSFNSFSSINLVCTLFLFRPLDFYTNARVPVSSVCLLDNNLFAETKFSYIVYLIFVCLRLFGASVCVPVKFICILECMKLYRQRQYTWSLRA